MICACIGLIVVDMPFLWSFTLAIMISCDILVGRSASVRRFTNIDLAFLLFYVSSLLSTIFAYDIAVALPELGRRTLFLLLYLAFSLSRERFRDILIASVLGMSLRCLGALLVFSGHYQEWSALRFGSLSTFRSFVTLTFNGERPGNYAAIYIVSLALAILSAREGSFQKRAVLGVSLVAAGLSAICVLVSFSRSLYICSAICIALSALGGKMPSFIKKRSVVIVTSCLLIAMMAVFWHSPILSAARETAAFQATLSQKRSAESRLFVTKAAFHLALKSGPAGAGLGNYALALRRAGMDSRQLLTTHPFNTALDVTIEQGIVGAVALVVLFISLASVTVRRFRTNEGKALFGGFFALSLYSMSQSFVITDQATAVLLAVVCALAPWTGDQYV